MKRNEFDGRSEPFCAVFGLRSWKVFFEIEAVVIAARTFHPAFTRWVTTIGTTLNALVNGQLVFSAHSTDHVIDIKPHAAKQNKDGQYE